MLRLICEWLALRKSEMEIKKAELIRSREAAERKLQIANAKRREEEARNARLNALGHQLQISFLQLPQCPDLRRQRSWVAHSSDLPLTFRQRQFARFKGMFHTECSRMLREGVGREQLLTDLRAIVVGLGIAAFEADYIINAILDRPEPEVDPNIAFQQRLVRIHAEHQQRLNAIESLEHLTDDDRQQLIEEEQSRYRQLLFGYRDMDLSDGFGNDATTG